MERKLAQIVAPLSLEKIYLTVLDIQYTLELSSSNTITLGQSFIHHSELIEADCPYPSYRSEAIDKLIQLRAIIDPQKSKSAMQRFNETNQRPITGQEYPGLSIVPGKIRRLRRILEHIRSTKGMGAVKGPLFPKLLGDLTKRRWADLEIKLCSDTEIRYRFNDDNWRRVSMSEIGLNDRRKGDAASDLWNALVRFGEEEGNVRLGPGSIKNLQKKVARLGIRLRSYFQIEGPPFYPYSKAGGYQSVFSISDDRPSTSRYTLSNEEEMQQEIKKDTESYMHESNHRPSEDE